MTSQADGKQTGDSQRRSLAARFTIRLLKVLLWTVLALNLTIGAVLICTVKILNPESLTPLVETIANKNLHANVRLSRIEFKLRPEYRGLGIEIDSLLIISKAFDSLPAEHRATLPAYADTLAAVDAMRASISLPALMSGRIDLRDIILRRPMLNIVLDGTGLNNFDIFPAPTDSTDTDKDKSDSSIPEISVSRFALESPRAIRYFNAADSTDATVLLLGDANISNHPLPDYTLHVDGRLNSPFVRQLVALEGLSLGMNGRLKWNPLQPSLIAAEEASIRVDDIEVRADAAVDFSESLIVQSARINLTPVAIETLLKYVPDSLKQAYSLTDKDFSTNAELSAGFDLTQPFNLDTDSIPHATANMRISPSKLRYGNARFDNIALDLKARLAGNNPDSITVEIVKLEAAGPATSLSLHGSASTLLSDPAFNACLKGRSNLAGLPSILTKNINGAISGSVTADIDVDGRMSMLNANAFHLLKVDGRIDANKLYFLSSDTATMAWVENAALRFNSRNRLKRPDGTTGPVTMTSSLKVDSIDVLSGGVGITASDISLGLGAENDGRLTDTTNITPLGGGLKIAQLKVNSITDSAGARLRGLGGFVSLRRFNGNERLPEFIFKLNADRLSAGDPSTRLMLRKTQIDFSAHKNPARRRKIPAAIRAAADSISRVRPDLPPDSVYRLALEKRRRRPGQAHHRRVHGELTADEREIIDWGTSNALRRFLLGWELQGFISTRHGRLFTPYFPLRNSVKELRIDFTSDSILLSDVKYSAGHSDLLINGRISNIRRSFTARGYRSPLKINFKIQSDTIDVNELAASTFAGAAYAEHIRRGGARGASFSDAGDDENALESSLEAMVTEKPDSSGPLLIPTNIEAEVNVRARNILYSDLSFTDFRGDVLVYDGAVNLHRLGARSDIGSLAMSALYNAPQADSMKFGFGLMVKQLQLERFLSLVPAVDSIVPIMRDFSGVINADVAATVDIDPQMNLVLPTLDAAVGLSGDSLRIVDPDTYRTLGKWLLFKDKTSDRIKHMNVEFIVENNMLQLFPFTFDIDRYRLGVQGYNDLALNFNYHLAVLKSPLPFKFGITVKGTPDDYKVRFGGAKFKEGSVAEQRAVVDTARINLISQIENVFRRGVSRSKFASLNVGRRPPRMQASDSGIDTLSRADSIALIREGLIPGTVPADSEAGDEAKPATTKKAKGSKKKSRQGRKNNTEKSDAALRSDSEDEKSEK